MNRQAFRQLLKRYLSGTASEDEKILVDQWFELLYNDNIPPLSGAELASVEQEMWNKLQQEGGFVREPIVPSKTPIRKIIIRYAAAAAVLIGISFGFYGIFSSKPQSISYQQIKEQNKLTEVINTSSEIKKVLMEDGTVITLQPSSKLAYPRQFTSDKREVYLEGEAFFNVAKNPVKPFLVHSGNIVTQVLGTSFTIKPDKESNKIIVSVKTGRVAVYEDKEQLVLNKEQQKNNGAIITANQKLEYDVAGRHFTTSLAENPEPIIANGDILTSVASFSFDEANLTTVFENISRAYGIEILTENETIYQCRFTGNITQQSLFEKLDLICQSTDHQYEIKGTKILIKGKGCN